MPTVAEVREALGIGDDPTYVVRIGTFGTDGSGPVIVEEDDNDNGVKVTTTDIVDDALAECRSARQAGVEPLPRHPYDRKPFVPTSAPPPATDLLNICTEVYNEVQRARAKHPTAFNSPHEGYAILKEEVEELWEHIKCNEGRKFWAREEAVQVAAMAVRYILDLAPDKDEEVQ